MKKTFNVKVNDKCYVVEVEETPCAGFSKRELSAELSDKLAHASSKKESSGILSVNAPLPGLIVEIGVQEGQHVESGEKLLVLEAMKMENSILSPIAGTIDKVEVKAGDSVNSKQLMISIRR